jgi:predicted Fe-Mo cluster-binding NifX family protein
MKLAITPWNQRVAPVFDSAERILILDMETHTGNPGQGLDEIYTLGHELDVSTKSPTEKAHFLADQGVEQLICGAISYDLERLIRDQGIDVYSFIAGPLEVVLNAWRTGQLNRPIYAMPGCVSGRHHRWGRQGTGTGYGRGFGGGYYAKR